MMIMLEVVVLSTTALIGLITLIKVLLEFRQRNKIDRINLYLRMRDKYARDSDIKEVCAALGNNDPPICQLTYQQKRLFLGTMESVALMVRSDVMDKHVAMYMFGYYIVKAWDADDFWGDGNIDQNDPMWALYKDFVFEIKDIKKEFEREPIYYARKKINFHIPLFRTFSFGTSIRNLNKIIRKFFRKFNSSR